MRTWPCRSAPGGCACHCHALSRGRATGKEPNRNAWKKAHDALLRERLAEGDSPSEIARLLTERFKVERTAAAVRLRMTRTGLTSRDGWVSRFEAGVLLGVGRKQMATWDAGGLLPSHPFGSWRRLRRSDLEAFVKAHAGLLFDARRVKDARLRSLAEVAAVANRRRAQGAA